TGTGVHARGWLPGLLRREPRLALPAVVRRLAVPGVVRDRPAKPRARQPGSPDVARHGDHGDAETKGDGLARVTLALQRDALALTRGQALGVAGADGGPTGGHRDISSGEGSSPRSSVAVSSGGGSLCSVAGKDSAIVAFFALMSLSMAPSFFRSLRSISSTEVLPRTDSKRSAETSLRAKYRIQPSRSLTNFSSRPGIGAIACPTDSPFAHLASCSPMSSLSGSGFAKTPRRKPGSLNISFSSLCCGFQFGTPSDPG